MDVSEAEYSPGVLLQAPDQTDAINELAAALAKAQGAIRNATKDSEADAVKYRYKYADLAAIWDACRTPLSDNGLAVMQRVRTEDDSVVVTTMLIHSSGQWVRDFCRFPVAQRTPQAYGSAITYARRYTLAALVGVAADDEDDDGSAASKGFSPPNRPQPQAQHRAEPTKKLEPRPEPKQSPKLRARVAALWKHAQERGVEVDRFQEWTSQHVGRKVASSTDLTEAEVTKLEEIAKLSVERQPGEEG